LLGGAFRFERDGYAGVCGANMGATVDGEPLRSACAFPIPAGSTLAFGATREGCRAYLAVAGGIDVPEVLGSRSTYVRAALGGLDGRPLRVGDLLPVGQAPHPSAPRALPSHLVPHEGGEVRLRVLPGPQDDHFPPEGIATFLGSEYRVTNRNDRMGYQLEGPPIRHARGPDIVSDALCPGAVQVPGSGMPIVMMADAQTTGGYAKIATVIGPDLRRLAQARLGDAVRFEACTDAEAVEALRQERGLIEEAVALLSAQPRQAARRQRRRAR
jgi:antagonist of KipI